MRHATSQAGTSRDPLRPKTLSRDSSHASHREARGWTERSRRVTRNDQNEGA